MRTLVSPFIDNESFAPDETPQNEARSTSSPFVQAFTLDGVMLDPNTRRDGARRVFMAELYDHELDEALYEVINEATGVVGNRPSRLDMPALELHFAPAVDELEAAMDRVAARFGTRDPSAITEAEVDEALNDFVPRRPLSPAFEQLFGGLKKLVKKVAKGAASLASKGLSAAMKLGLGPILNKLKGLIRPLLDRVLKTAINRLPTALQAPARQLATRLVGKEAADENDQPAVDVEAIQNELDGRIADMLMQEPENSQEEISLPSPSSVADGSIAELDGARDRFIAELGYASSGEDAGPAVEHFLPALLPVLKLGIKLAGRPRVVSLLGGLLGKLIGGLVGPAQTTALSTALVDAGLKTLDLEVSNGDQRAARAGIAATVEDTVRAVTELPETTLENPALLEGSIVKAFESAAAANLPPLLPRVIYRQRPDLIETDHRRGAWIPLIAHGPKRYKKYTRVVRTRITPRMALAIPIFGDVPLAMYLQEQLGLEPGEELEADVHLYEAMPGMVLGDVIRGEAESESLATADFHPLSTEAAALLIGEPGLGRRVATHGTAHRIAVGQRFYRIAGHGHKVRGVRTAGSHNQTRRRRTSVHVSLDFPADKIQLRIFLAERRAQELSASLRGKAHGGVAAAALRGIIDRGVAGALSGQSTGHVRIVHEALTPTHARGPGLNRLPAEVATELRRHIGEWSLGALADFFTKQAPRFIAAADDSQDGVTITVTIANPPGFPAVRNALGGVTTAHEVASGPSPASVQVDVAPGYISG